VLEALATAWGYLGHVNVILLIFLGCVIGLVFGALPGLGGVVALAIMLPFTYGWEPMAAMFFFAAIMGAVPFGGSISAILINTPGTAPNAATCFDGYPMAQRGEGGKALGISATASGLGAIFGLVVLLILIPVVRQVIMLFGPPEFLMLVLFGLVTIAFAARGNMLRGLISGGLGIFISLIGYSSVFGVLRFNFGSEFLWDGLRLVPFLIGIFAISELINLSVRGGIIAGERMPGKLGGVLDGAKEVFRNKLCFFRSSAIGTTIGLIPGVGGTVANFLGYVAAMQTSKHRELFGKGNPEGVVASESSNNAKDGGALLPTIAFGIPGSAEMAVLLGAFVLHGLVPGPIFLRDQLDIVFALILGLLLSNIIASTFGLIAGNFLARLTTVRVSYIIPIVLVVCLVGSFADRGNLWDVAVALVAGIFGYALVKSGFSTICLVIGYILGVIAERAFHMSLMISYGSYAIFFTQPISLALFILIIFVLLLPFIGRARAKGRS